MHYILIGHDVVPTSLEAWARWFETADRKVAYDEIGEMRVSTVFLGLDHDFSGKGPPLIFETMVFAGKTWNETACHRCTTWNEAIAQHEKEVKRLKQAAHMRMTKP